MALINELRNKFSRSRQKPVSVDSFIYSLSEESELLRKSHKLREESLYPSLKTCLGEEGSKTIKEVLEDVFSWHKEKSKNILSENDTLDYVKMISVSHSLASLCFDLDRVITEFSCEYPFLDKIKKEKIVIEVLEEETKKNLEEETEKSLEETLVVEELVEGPLVLLRSELISLLEKYFFSYKDYLLAFLDWSHKKVFKREFDFDSLPPSGRALGLIKRCFPSSELVWGKKASFQPERTESSDRPSHQDEKKAMDEVHEALRQLKRDKRLTSLQLKPQNSYLRRLQHSLIVSKGFDSKSSGVEPQRFIMIQKKKDE